MLAGAELRQIGTDRARSDTGAIPCRRLIRRRAARDVDEKTGRLLCRQRCCAGQEQDRGEQQRPIVVTTLHRLVPGVLCPRSDAVRQNYLSLCACQPGECRESPVRIYGTTGTIMMIVLNLAGSAPRFGFKKPCDPPQV